MVCVIRVMRTKRVSVIFNSIFLVPVNHETSLSIVCIYVYTVCATTVYSFLVLFILLCVTPAVLSSMNPSLCPLRISTITPCHSLCPSVDVRVGLFTNKLLCMCTGGGVSGLQERQEEREEETTERRGQS